MTTPGSASQSNMYGDYASTAARGDWRNSPYNPCGPESTHHQHPIRHGQYQPQILGLQPGLQNSQMVYTFNVPPGAMPQNVVQYHLVSQQVRTGFTTENN